MLGSLDDSHESLILASGLATKDQIAQARKTIEQMNKLGTRRGLLEILVERNVIAPEVSALIQKQASDAQDSELAIEVVDEAVEVVDEAEEAVEVAEEPLEVAEEASRTAAAFCVAHPRKPAVGECASCGEALCSDCVIRVRRKMYCSQDCVMRAGEDRPEEPSELLVKMGKALAYARWPIIGAVGLLLLLIGKAIVDDYRASMAIGVARVRGETTREGMEALKRAASLRPNRADIRTKYGEALLQAGEAAQAIQEFQAAVSREPKNVQAVMGLSTAYMMREMGAEAAEALAGLRKVNIASAETEFRLGKIYRDNLNQQDLAADAFERALKLGTESREVRYEVGKAYYRQGNYDEANRQLSLALEPVEFGDEALLSRERSFLKSERAADASVLKAEILAKDGKLGEAETLLARAQSNGPPSLSLVIARARLLLQQNRSGEALRILTDARSAHHSNAEFLTTLADTAEAQKEGDSLLWALRRLYEDTKDLAVLDRLILAEAEYGSATTTLRLLKELPQAMRHEKRYLPAWFATIRHDMQNGRVKAAEQELNALGAKAHGEPAYAVLKCDMLLMKQAHEEALSLAEMAIRHNPADPMGLALAGAALRNMGRVPEAARRLQQSLDNGGGPRTITEMALLQWQAGATAEARKLLTGLASARSGTRVDQGRVNLLLARLQSSEMGNYFRTSACSRIMSLIGSTVEVESCIREMAIATAAVTRTYAMIAGMVVEGTFEGEREWLRSNAITGETLSDYGALLGEQTRTMLADGAKALTMLSPQAASDIEAIRSGFIRQIGAKANGAEVYVIGADAHVRMLRAAIAKHPAADGLGLVLSRIDDRMRARTFISPGVFQPAAASDIAFVEMAVAAIDKLPQGFMYAGAANAVLKEIRSVREGATPLTQARDARLAVLKVLTLLNAQATENNLVDMAGGKL